MERHIELGDVDANIQPQTSTFYSRRRQVKRRRFQSDEYSTRGGSNISGSLDGTPITQPLLLILRLLSYYKIQLFSVGPSQTWNLRQTLGEGSTFSVDGANLPIWRGLSDLRYRNLDLKGPKEKFYFNDHTQTKWDHNTLVAYKVLVSNKDMDRSMIIVDMITELRVLCHPPLQNHPNIVRLLGVAWVREIDLGSTLTPAPNQSAEDFEMCNRPTVVVERAPYGSLLDFLRSDEFRATRSSLVAKVYLCLDVLNGITVRSSIIFPASIPKVASDEKQALHACDILHGDIKCENALVFKTENGTAENWRVKISDFGHSILNMEGKTPDEFTRREVLGTDFYSPPELNDAEAILEVANMKSVDIWCWGLLMWKVMIDGADYAYADGPEINRDEMQTLREHDRMATTAKDACEKYLNAHHSRESTGFSTILGVLLDALCPNASDRPNAPSLLSRLKRFSGEK